MARVRNVSIGTQRRSGNANTLRASFEIEVVGADELEQAFLQLEKKDRRRFLRKALREAFKPVLREIRAAAPRDRGILARKIKLRATKRSRSAIGVKIETGTREQLGIPKSEGTKLPGYYPAHVELGTKTRAARPFMRPALKRMRGGTLQHLELSLWKWIDGHMAEQRRAAKVKGADA